ncbi:MAG TPA: hypothetical protein VGT24_01715 [Candidatus Acidoferrales bacterium]|nr:hypothetical protein [Candidatus Acidoferrales bacterium]
MKSLPTFLSMVVLLWLLAVMMPLSRIRGHWLIVVFLVAQFAFTMLCFMAVQRVGADSASYRVIFPIAAFMAMAASLGVAFSWASELGLGNALLAIFVSACVPIASAAIVSDSAGERSHFYLGCGALFIFPGMLSLLTIVLPHSHADTVTRLGLSLFWILIGVYFYAAAASMGNSNLEWAPQHPWIPSLIAILVFGLLAFSLSRAQRETAQQAVYADVAEVAR